MAEPASAAELARTLADALERHKLPYAIGGAIALGTTPFHVRRLTSTSTYSSRRQTRSTVR